jgi:hypothetical protein
MFGQHDGQGGPRNVSNASGRVLGKAGRWKGSAKPQFIAFKFTSAIRPICGPLLPL